MRFKTFDLRAYSRKDETILSFDIKGGRIPTSRILYIKKGNPFKMKISHEIAEHWRIRQEIKQSQMNNRSPEGLYPLVEQVENGIAKFYDQEEIEHWGNRQRVFAYEDIYEVAFNRGVRHERKRRKAKYKPLTAFDLISADDVTELSRELEICEDKLTYAVMEVISKRKNGGMA